MLKTIDPAKNAISTIKRLIATGDDIIIYRLVLVPKSSNSSFDEKKTLIKRIYGVYIFDTK